MDAKMRKMTEVEYIDYFTDSFGIIEICPGVKFKSGEIYAKMDPKGFKEAIDTEGYLWECNSCGNEYNDSEKAEECCFSDYERT